MIAIALLLAVVAFALLGLATDAHHGRWYRRRPDAATKRRFRRIAWSLLAVSFVPSVLARGWAFGPVVWSGLVMLAAGGVFLFLNFASPPAARTDRKA